MEPFAGLVVDDIVEMADPEAFELQELPALCSIGNHWGILHAAGRKINFFVF